MRKWLFVLLGCLVWLCGCSSMKESHSNDRNNLDAEEYEITAEVVKETKQEAEDYDIQLGEVDEQSTPIEQQEVQLPEELNAFSLVEQINIGWNLGNSLDSWYKNEGYDANLRAEVRWGNPVVTKELIDYVASMGFNTIRIPVTWYYNSGRDEQGHLLVGEQWIARVREIVDYAVANDMFIIINTMHDSQKLFACGVEEEERWASIQQDAKDLWQQIAENFDDYDEKLIFESYNELDNAARGRTYSDLSVQQMNTLNQIFVDTVRSSGGNNQKRILMVPTLFDSPRTNILDAFVLPRDTVENRLIATVHCYEDRFDQDIEWIFQALEDFSNRIGAPVVIGEFGARDNYMLSWWRDEYSCNYIARAAKHGIKCCVWDDGNHWKLVDRHDYQKTNYEVIDALFRGIEGECYETARENKIIFDSMEHFHFAAMNLGTGDVMPVDYQKKFWAAITTKDENGERLKILSGDKIVINMVTKNQAVDFWIYGITFFDENQEAISYKVGKNIVHKYLCVSIPEGAVYYAINSYDPYRNHKLEQLEQYFAAGDLQMSITFVDENQQDLLHKVSE